MTISKSEIKLQAVHEVGCRIEDVLEAHRKDVFRQEGARTAFQISQKVVQDLMPLVDREVDEGDLTLEEASKVKRFLTRGAQGLENLVKQSQNLQLVVSGKVQGLEQIVQLVQKIHTDEQVRQEASLQASPEPIQGESPPSLKSLRLAEEKALTPGPKLPPKPVKLPPKASPKPVKLPPKPVKSKFSPKSNPKSNP